jgi:hypothetical protein
VDNFGNWSGVGSSAVANIEKIAPAQSGGFSVSTSSWTRNPVTVGSTWADNGGGSGVAHVYCRLVGGSYNEGWTDGGANACSRTAGSNTTYSAYAVDRAGNASGTVTYAIGNIDTTSPTNPDPATGCKAGYRKASRTCRTLPGARGATRGDRE